jgi:uncharacterized membrane protein YgdD (TMEM256/DUF423 family)
MREYILQPAMPILLLAIGILLGAFGAHGLEPHLTEKSLSVWEKAVFYQLINGAALLSVSLYQQEIIYRRQRWACLLVTTGTVLFSGSLYFLATKDMINWGFTGILGPITPIGGSLMISGWIWLALTFGKRGQIVFRD